MRAVFATTFLLLAAPAAAQTEPEAAADAAAAPADAPAAPPAEAAPERPPAAPYAWTPYPYAPAPRYIPPAPAAPEPAAPVAKPAEQEAPDASEEVLEPAPHHFSADLGFRLGVVRGAGFDPYGDNDNLPQLALGFGYTPVFAGDFGFGVAGEYDVGGSSAMARGDEASLTTHRIAVGLQAHYQLWRFSFYARALPGLVHARAEIQDPGIDRALDAAGTTWSFEASGGVRFRLGAAGPREAPHVSFWLLGEGGYLHSGDIDVTFMPEVDESDPRTFGALALPPLALSGGTTRLAFGLGF